MNVAGNLEVSALFFSDNPAVREGDHVLTYGQLHEKANRVATGLIKMGVKRGDLIGLCAPNSADWIAFYYGVIKAGAVAVTLFNNTTNEELRNLLLHAKPKILLTTESRYGWLQNVKDECRLETVICPSGEGDMSLGALMDTGVGSFTAVERNRSDVAAVLYTGGTTGIPKGVMLTHEGMNFSSRAIAYYERSTEHDLALCFLPFNHVFGQMHIMNSTIYSGGCLELLPSFDMEHVLDLMGKNRVTKFFSVPTVYVRLLALPDLKEKLGKVRYCFSAGAAMALEIVKEWKNVTGITIAESYGMTEAMPVTFNHFYPERHVAGSVGQAVHGVEIQIRDTKGPILNGGEQGEICVRGRNVMRGYLNNPEATLDAFWEGEWLRTGDVGYRDERGYIHLVDRLKELIITGGENVYPREVEEALYGCPEVAECAVVGLPDRQWGERVVAFITPRRGKTVVADDLKAALKGRLSAFKIPKEYIVMDELPKSAAGKILKRDIKKNYLDKR